MTEKEFFQERLSMLRNEPITESDADIMLDILKENHDEVPRTLRTPALLTRAYNAYLHSKDHGEFLCEKDAKKYAEDEFGEDAIVVPLKTNMESGEKCIIDFEGEQQAPFGNKADVFELYEIRNIDKVCLGYVWFRQRDKKKYTF